MVQTETINRELIRAGGFFVFNLVTTGGTRDANSILGCISRRSQQGACAITPANGFRLGRRPPPFFLCHRRSGRFWMPGGATRVDGLSNLLEAFLRGVRVKAMDGGPGALRRGQAVLGKN